MELRKRTWKGSDGKNKTSYFVDYVDPVSGERRRQVLKGIKDKPKADKAAAKFYSDLCMRAHMGDAAGPTDNEKLFKLGNFLDDDLKRVIADSTRATERHQHKPLKRHLGEDTPVVSLTLAMLQQYQIDRCDEVETSTVNDELNILRAALNRAKRDKRLWKMPCEMPDKLPEEETQKRSLTPSQVERLFTALRDLYPETADHAELIYRLGGLRPIELWAMKWKDVDFEQGNISVLSKKHGRSKKMIRRVLPITPRVAGILERFRARAGEKASGENLVCGKLPKDRKGHCPQAKKRGHKDGVVFLGDYRFVDKFKEAAAKAKLPDPDSVTPYALRHSAATNSDGATLKEVSYMLGHRDVRTTAEIYQHVRQDRFNKGMNSLSGHKKGTKKKPLSADE